MQPLSRTIAKAPLHSFSARTLALCTFSTSPHTFSEAAPSLFGGFNSWSHSTNIEQATGLERLQLHGADVFNMSPLNTKPSTINDPTLVLACVSGGC
jgi:hypothetical protein